MWPGIPAAYQKLLSSDCGYPTAKPCYVYVGLEKHPLRINDSLLVCSAQLEYWWEMQSQWLLCCPVVTLCSRSETRGHHRPKAGSRLLFQLAHRHAELSDIYIGRSVPPGSWWSVEWHYCLNTTCARSCNKLESTQSPTGCLTSNFYQFKRHVFCDLKSYTYF